MDLSLASELFAASVRMGTPLLLLGLAALMAERSGVVNVGLEGMLLAGCFGAVAGAIAGGSAAVGLLLAVASSVALMGLFALLVVRHGQNQILVGTAVNLLALGLTGFLFRSLFGLSGSATAPPGFAAYRVPGFEAVPLVGPALSGQPLLTWAAFLLVPGLALFLRHTRQGLAIDAAGQLPEAAEAAGWSVPRIRYASLGVAGVLAGMAGAHLALVHAHGFVEGMSAGRGFIALAIVIFGRWRPAGVLVASLFFGLAIAAQYHLQAAGSGLPYQAIRSLPFLLTLLVLAVAGGGSRKAPAALGQPLQRHG